jgi:hypothetical protein
MHRATPVGPSQTPILDQTAGFSICQGKVRKWQHQRLPEDSIIPLQQHVATHRGDPISTDGPTALRCTHRAVLLGALKRRQCAEPSAKPSTLGPTSTRVELPPHRDRQRPCCYVVAAFCRATCHSKRPLRSRCWPAAIRYCNCNRREFRPRLHRSLKLLKPSKEQRQKPRPVAAKEDTVVAA